MSSARAVFVDANVLVYFLDETAELHADVVGHLQELVDNQVRLYTSHHVIEEVLFIVYKISRSKDAVDIAVREIAALPNLMLAEPEADFSFVKRYAKRYRSSKVGINDTLLLQLMIDAGISELFSYDEQFLKQAAASGIRPA